MNFLENPDLNTFSNFHKTKNVENICFETKNTVREKIAEQKAEAKDNEKKEAERKAEEAKKKEDEDKKYMKRYGSLPPQIWAIHSGFSSESEIKFSEHYQISLPDTLSFENNHIAVQINQNADDEKDDDKAEKETDPTIYSPEDLKFQSDDIHHTIVASHLPSVILQ